MLTPAATPQKCYFVLIEMNNMLVIKIKECLKTKRMFVCILHKQLFSFFYRPLRTLLKITHRLTPKTHPQHLRFLPADANRVVQFLQNRLIVHLRQPGLLGVAVQRRAVGGRAVG